jgi:hypothetical protein
VVKYKSKKIAKLQKRGDEVIVKNVKTLILKSIWSKEP